MNDQPFSPNKLYSFSDLIGQILRSPIDNNRDRFTTDAGTWEIYLEDDGAGGNDSHAFVESVGGWEELVGKKIASVDDPDDRDCGCTVTIKSDEGQTAEITFVHEHNGYYGYSYGLSFIGA